MSRFDLKQIVVNRALSGFKLDFSRCDFVEGMALVTNDFTFITSFLEQSTKKLKTEIVARFYLDEKAILLVDLFYKDSSVSYLYRTKKTFKFNSVLDKWIKK